MVGGVAPPPKKWGAPPHGLVPKTTFTDVFDNTYDISDFRVHIFCPQTTQELFKKHKKARRPEQLPTVFQRAALVFKFEFL